MLIKPDILIKPATLIKQAARIKQMTLLLLLFLFSLFGVAKAATQVVNVKSELAAPVMLANSEDKNYLKISLTGLISTAPVVAQSIWRWSLIVLRQ